MESHEPRHRDPIIFDSLVLLAIQSGFYILSRRFLLHALPALRNISKQGTEAEGAEPPEDAYALRNLRGRNGGDDDGVYTEEEGDGLLNASGGFSDIEAGNPQRNPTSVSLSASRTRWKAGVESDSDDDGSDATRSYAGSPLPSPSLDLTGPNGASTTSLINQEAGLASSNFNQDVSDDFRGHTRRISAMNGHNLPAIRTPGTPNSPTTPTFGSSGRRQEPQVLRIFKPRGIAAAARTGGGKEKEKVGATRGLGFLAR
jgi:hypothetical protein